MKFNNVNQSNDIDYLYLAESYFRDLQHFTTKQKLWDHFELKRLSNLTQVQFFESQRSERESHQLLVVAHMAVSEDVGKNTLLLHWLSHDLFQNNPKQT